MVLRRTVAPVTAVGLASRSATVIISWASSRAVVSSARIVWTIS
jgi:hypothetical protein